MSHGNVWRALVFATFVHTPVFVPVVVLFWEDNGLDMSDIFALQGLYAVAVVLLEVPTGLVSDRLGRRTSLLTACAVFAAGLALYGVGTGFWWFLVAELALALASALLSGADAALLYDTLKLQGQEQTFAMWEGRARALQLTSFAVANVLGGLAAGWWSLRSTLWLSAVGPMVAGVAAWGFVEVNPPAAMGSMRAGLQETLRLTQGALRFVSRQRLVRWYLLFLAVLTASGSWLLWLYQPYMSFTGLPLWAFGGVFAVYNLWAAASSAVAGRVASRLGERGTLLWVAALQLLPLPLMATFVGPASCLLVLGHQTVRGVARPFIAQRVLEHTWSDRRATVLSLGALGGRLLFAVTAVGIGWAADTLTLPGALWVQAVVLTVLLLALAVEWPRIDDKYRRVKDPAAQVDGTTEA